ncbi:hypothetical protein [Rhizobium sp. YTU87027]|uniref:hypothetical protein n=1 Tax=Rhizobium sp. YTU87027 TaxID=3417741 RepID=UPI003D69E2F9
MALILVRGGCGFIGRHLAEELFANEHDLRVLDALFDLVYAGSDLNPVGSTSALRAIRPTGSFRTRRQWSHGAQLGFVALKDPEPEVYLLARDEPHWAVESPPAIASSR